MTRFTQQTTPTVQQLIQQKLDAFEQLQAEFEQCFQFVQDVHGERRFTSFPVADTVRYLHARWVCELKSRLLGVAQTVKEYEGRLCLELLLAWQEGDTASVVDFLHRRLDMLPLSNITRQFEEAKGNQQEPGLAQRLAHGRLVMLNRGFHLMYALDVIFTLSDIELLREVRASCERYGHRPEQIGQQLAALDTPLYAYVPHQLLAQRNMMVMNALGINVTQNAGDRLGQRSWRVVEPVEPLSPYAEHVVEGYQELVSPTHNNSKRAHFVDRPEVSDEGEV